MTIERAGRLPIPGPVCRLLNPYLHEINMLLGHGDSKTKCKRSHLILIGSIGQMQM